MARFTPREKLGKKAKRALDQAKRQTWGAIRPATKRIESKKRYRRTDPPRLPQGDHTGDCN